jgi:Zn-dependent protease/CBS domain-containing protein
MTWSFRIAQIAGINIRVHITFFLILALGAIQWGGQGGGLEGALFGVVLMLLLFTCVTLHELGHSIVANRLGVPVREIILLPLGGVAVMNKQPEKPIHEFLIAIAGPLVNVVIALLLAIPVGAQVRMALLDGRGLIPEAVNDPSLNTLLFWLFSANISLVVFNLIPAFPLDGGRILRSLLALAIGFPRATRVAITIGQLIAIGLGIFGVLSGNLVLALIAVFIFFGAGQEATNVRVTGARGILDMRKIGDAYNKHALTLSIGDKVSTVVDFILTSYQPDYAVLQGAKPIGILTRDDVIRSLASLDHDAYVTEVMKREMVSVDADKSVEEARTILQEQGARVGLVMRDGNYLGLVSLEDIQEAMAVLTFVQYHSKRKGSAAA